MIRGYTENGSMWLGLVRGPLLDRLLAGERVCIPGHLDASGVHYPHLCLFVRDTNAELLAACDEYFPGGYLPGAVVEQATTEEPDGS